jgi:hypothetical protein
MGINTPATGKPTSVQASQSLTPGFGSWTTADANKPVLLSVAAAVATTAGNPGEIQIEVDEDGGTTADYDLGVAFVDPTLGDGSVLANDVTVPLPAGAQFRLVNTSDPTGGNNITEVRATPVE